MGTQDFTPETLPNQLRQAANMIDMGMGEKHKMDFRGFHRPSGQRQGFILTHGNAAVNEYIQVAALKKMTGTRNAFFTTNMGNFENPDLPPFLMYFSISYDDQIPFASIQKKEDGVQKLSFCKKNHEKQRPEKNYNPSDAFTGFVFKYSRRFKPLI
jgi:hypothetical protein